MKKKTKKPSKKYRKISSPSCLGARELSFLLLTRKDKHEFIEEALQKKLEETNLNSEDKRLVQKLCYGLVKREKTLHLFAKQLCPSLSSSMKSKEKKILYLALYQYIYLSKIPLYAIANESMKLAKKYCHTRFVNFLNAQLHKLSTIAFYQNIHEDSQSLSENFSYPLSFVQSLKAAFTPKEVKSILDHGNQELPIFARLRNKKLDTAPQDQEIKCTLDLKQLRYVQIPKQSNMKTWAKSPHIYIQNPSPGALMEELLAPHLHFKRALDLCASPGGKSILLSELAKVDSLYCNDISEKKILRLQENVNKYGIKAQYLQKPAQEIESEEEFDLLLADVPCSNSGVFNKRCEARWRHCEKNLSEILKLQWDILSHAQSLLGDQGVILYMTCSILPQENEDMIQRACKEYKLKKIKEKKILPDGLQWEGAYGALLQK